MHVILDADVALELWDIFAISIQPKEKNLVSDAYVDWLLGNNMSDEDLMELARNDSVLSVSIARALEVDDEEEEIEE